MKTNWHGKGSRKSLLKLLLSVTVIASTIAVVPAPILKAAGIAYYVDQDGSDSNNGTSLSAPFQSIQHAASVATAGDTVYIRGGTYHESVAPVNSGTTSQRITYRNYNGEPVTVSGSDIVTGWTLDSGNIYKASIVMPLGSQNQVFANGSVMYEARWPNNTGSITNFTRAAVTSGSLSGTTESLTATSFPWSNASDLSGAYIWIAPGYEWSGYTRNIQTYNPATKTITYDAINPTSAYYHTSAGDKFILVGSKALLDTENEWWYDNVNLQLYLWFPGGGAPGSNAVEVKARQHAFDLSGKSYITIDGINVRSATVVTDDASTNNVLENMKLEYVSHDSFNTANEQSDLGLLLKGAFNEINSCEIAYSSGPLVNIQGNDNKLINSYVHDGNYLGSYFGHTKVSGRRALVSHNTFSESGRDVIQFSGVSESNIQYNNVYGAGRLTKDVGVMYAANADGQNTLIHHNLVHDNYAVGYADGIYPDEMSHNFIIYQNVIYNIRDKALHLNQPSNYNLVYHNSTYNNSSFTNSYTATFTDVRGSQIINNITTNGMSVNGNTIRYNNLTSGSAGYVNPGANNFLLTSSSPAIDGGTLIPGFNNGYNGSAPDIGAYEYGSTSNTFGHNFENPPVIPTAPNLNTTFLYRNLIKNGGFEYGTLESWTKADAQTASIHTENAWHATWKNSRSGNNSIKLGTGVDSIQQVVTGLAPNTAYTVTAWLKSSSGEAGQLEVSNYGGTSVAASSTSTSWAERTITFKTGPSSTSVTISIKKTNSGTGYIYADDIGMQRVLPAPSDANYSVEPAADAYVFDGNSTANFGSEPVLQNKSGTANYVREAFLKFDLSSIPSNSVIDKAIMRVFTTDKDAGTSSAAAYPVADDSWTESGITWSNKPSAGTLITSNSVGLAGSWQSYDVTSFIAGEYSGDKLASFTIKDPNNSNKNVYFSSKEGVIAPVLDLTVSSPYTVSPSTDAFVWDANVNTNYGSDPTLLVKAGTTGYQRQSYLKFDLSSIPAGTTINQATLKAFINTKDAANVTLGVYPATTDAWTESTVTWANKPALGTSIATSQASAAGVWLTFDVTDYVNGEYDGDKMASLCIKDPSGANVYVALSSKEGAHAPVLELITD